MTVTPYLLNGLAGFCPDIHKHNKVLLQRSADENITNAVVSVVVLGDLKM